MLAGCREAGVAILAARNTALAADRKPDGSLVSAADHAASAILGFCLRALDASVPVVCEEASQDSAGSARFWLVDPLDGTREFLRGSDAFSVNVALVEDGVPVFGVIHLPASGISYWGQSGAGAWRDGLAIRARPLAAAGSVRLLVSPGQEQALQLRLGPLLERRFREQEIDGIAGAIKFCWLAEGRADLYPRRTRTCAWDTAAGQAILEAAGGAVYDADWQRLRYRQSPGWYNGDFVAAADADADWASLLET